MKNTKWWLANLVCPVLVGILVVNWDIFESKIIAFVLAGFITALILDLVLYYPRFSKFLKEQVKRFEPQKLFLVANPIVDNKISLKLCTKGYIYVRRIEIGTKEKWLIIHSDSFSLDAGKCKEIEFVKLNKPLKYFTLSETHKDNENSFERFGYAVHPFDIHVGFKFSKNGADQDRFWRAKVDYTESGQISVEVEDVK